METPHKKPVGRGRQRSTSSALFPPNRQDVLEKVRSDAASIAAAAKSVALPISLYQSPQAMPRTRRRAISVPEMYLAHNSSATPTP